MSTLCWIRVNGQEIPVDRMDPYPRPCVRVLGYTCPTHAPDGTQLLTAEGEAR